MALGRLMEGFITILIGVNLIGPVADQVEQSTTNGNVTGSSATILDLVTLFFALGIMVAGVNIAVGEHGTLSTPPHLEVILYGDNPNIGSTSSTKGQDRGVKHENYAVETDKGGSFFEFEIQSEPRLYIKSRSEVEMTSPLLI